MNKLAGWKTILFAVVTALLGVVDSISDIVTIPEWYYIYIVPVVMFLLRWITDGPIGLKKLLK